MQTCYSLGILLINTHISFVSTTESHDNSKCGPVQSCKTKGKVAKNGSVEWNDHLEFIVTDPLNETVELESEGESEGSLNLRVNLRGWLWESVVWVKVCLVSGLSLPCLAGYRDIQWVPVIKMRSHEGAKA
jgi:hypothetical protein